MAYLDKYRAIQAARAAGGPGGAPMAPAAGLNHTEQQEDADMVKTHPVGSGAALGAEGAQMQHAGDEQDENAAIKALLARLGLG